MKSLDNSSLIILAVKFAKTKGNAQLQALTHIEIK